MLLVEPVDRPNESLWWCAALSRADGLRRRARRAARQHRVAAAQAGAGAWPGAGQLQGVRGRRGGRAPGAAAVAARAAVPLGLDHAPRGRGGRPHRGAVLRVSERLPAREEHLRRRHQGGPAGGAAVHPRLDVPRVEQGRVPAPGGGGGPRAPGGLDPDHPVSNPGALHRNLPRGQLGDSSPCRADRARACYPPHWRPCRMSGNTRDLLRATTPRLP
mmetsp:Transcript_9607/g.24383  ORF Transcript_9607/g.24383 Transcript_9607/m.24383 type:complete len:217 (+) Transcript_9607:31-681(+)